jgi:hypothetical protein
MSKQKPYTIDFPRVNGKKVATGPLKFVLSGL